MSEVTLSLPFSIDSYGKVVTTTDQKKIWSDRVRSVLGTALRERVMRPTFGTLIPYALFDTSTTAETQIKSEVTRAFNMQLPLLNLDSVEVTVDEYTNVMTVDVVYDLPNQETVSTSVGLILVEGTTPIYQELL